MSELASPRSRDLVALQDWLRRPTLGGVYLTGRDRNIWAEGTDLMLLAKQAPSNYFTRWISDSLAPMYHHTAMSIQTQLVRIKYNASPKGVFVTNVEQRKSSVQDDSGIAQYSEAGIATAARMVGAVLASLLPILAIVVLYLVDNTGARLGLVAVFSAIFSTTLWFLNDGKLIEVFSATSA